MKFFPQLQAKLSDAQKGDLRKLFDSYDTNKDHTISRNELKAAFQKMGFPKSDMEITELLSKYDTDKSGDINFDEFCNYNVQAINKELFKVCFHQ